MRPESRLSQHLRYVFRQRNTENPAGQTRRRVNICRLALLILSRTRLKSGYRRSLLAAAVLREQLREGSAPSNRNFYSTTAEVCVTVKHGLRSAYPKGVIDPLRTGSPTRRNSTNAEQLQFSVPMGSRF